MLARPRRLRNGGSGRRPWHRGGPDLSEASGAPGPGGAHAVRPVRRPAPPRHRRESPPVDGQRSRARYGPAARRDARVRGGPAGGTRRARRARGGALPSVVAERLARAAPRPPILLAGLGPRMLELAGEIADGAVLWLCAPAYIRDHAVPAVARGRARAGKPLADSRSWPRSRPPSPSTARPGWPSSGQSWCAICSCRSTAPCWRGAASGPMSPRSMRVRARRGQRASRGLARRRRGLRGAGAVRLGSPRRRRHPAGGAPRRIPGRPALPSHPRGGRRRLTGARPSACSLSLRLAGCSARGSSGTPSPRGPRQ